MYMFYILPDRPPHTRSHNVEKGDRIQRIVYSSVIDDVLHVLYILTLSIYQIA